MMRFLKCYWLHGLWLMGSFFVSLIGFYYPDLWWQLREAVDAFSGESRSLAERNSFGFPSQDFAGDYWFYKWVIGTVFQFGGWLGLRIFFTLLAISPFFMLTFILLRWRLPAPELGYLLGGIGALFLFQRIEHRPEMVGFICQFLTTVLLILPMSGLNGWRLLAFLLLGMVWSNCHGSFAIGVIVFLFQGFFSALVHFFKKEAGIFSIKTWMLSFGAFVFGCTMTPAGFDRLFEPLRLQTDQWAKVASPEMWPMPVGYLPLLLLLFLILTWVFIKGKIQLRYYWFLLATAFFVWMSIVSVRYATIFGVHCLAMGVVASFTKEKFVIQKWSPLLVSFILLIGVVGRQKLVLNSLTLDFRGVGFGVAALEELEEKGGAQGAMLCHPAVGSYIQWQHPELTPLIDTGFARFEDDTVRYLAYLKWNPEAFEIALNSLRVDYVMISSLTRQWIPYLEQHPNWKLMHQAPDGWVFQRISHDSFDLSELDPSEDQIADFDKSLRLDSLQWDQPTKEWFSHYTELLNGRLSN